MHNHLQLMNERERERERPFHDRAEIDTLAKTIESKVEHENETVTVLMEILTANKVIN